MILVKTKPFLINWLKFTIKIPIQLPSCTKSVGFVVNMICYLPVLHAMSADWQIAKFAIIQENVPHAMDTAIKHLLLRVGMDMTLKNTKDGLRVIPDAAIVAGKLQSAILVPGSAFVSMKKNCKRRLSQKLYHWRESSLLLKIITHTNKIYFWYTTNFTAVR